MYIILGLKINIMNSVDALDELRAYLLSDKFHNDTTVQVSDILRRLDEVPLRDDERFREGQTIYRRSKNK